jgi:GntR family transcriptional regulator of vanillate catabolism
MRGVLEGAAARLAAERVADPSELGPIKELQRRMDEIANNTFESFAHYMDLNNEFHMELVRLAKSPMLERTVHHLISLPFAGAGAGVYSRARPHHDLAVIGWQQHHALLDAIEHRQGTRAEAVAREHANLARRHLEVVVEDGLLSTFLKGGALVRVEKNTPDGANGQPTEEPGRAN